MKLSLRHRSFLWLMVFMVGCFLLNFGIDLLHDWYSEGGVPEGAGAGELHEFGFIALGNLIVMPAVLWTGWLVVRAMLRPIDEAAATARRISAGRLSERVPVPAANDEFSDLIRSMNQAFDSYHHTLSQMRRFSANAAHQFRAPLAAMRAEGEVCLSRARSAGEYREALQANLERVNQLSRMTEQMLALAEIEQSEWESRFSAVDLAAVAESVAADYRPLAEDADVAMENKVEPGATTRGDRELLYQMFANVVDNALRFTPRGGSITLSSSRAANGRLVVHVDDTGPGIPEPLRVQVFQRFDQGAHSDTTGSGLGLAIVSEIVHVHHGTVRAAASPSGGARITLEFPAA